MLKNLDSGKILGECIDVKVYPRLIIYTFNTIDNEKLILRSFSEPLMKENFTYLIDFYSSEYQGKKNLILKSAKREDIVSEKENVFESIVNVLTLNEQQSQILKEILKDNCCFNYMFDINKTKEILLNRKLEILEELKDDEKNEILKELKLDSLKTELENKKNELINILKTCKVSDTKISKIKEEIEKLSYKDDEEFKDINEQIDFLDFTLKSLKHNIDKINKNPYILINDLECDYLSLDKYALQNLSLDFKSENRIIYGIIDLLNKSSFKGHCYLEINYVVDYIMEKLNIDNSDLIFNILKTSEYFFTIENDLVYLTEVYNQEVLLANCINESCNNNNKKANKKTLKVIEDILDNLFNEKGFVLNEEQKEACIEFNKRKNGLYILNGSAGTGKTFTANVIKDICIKLSNKKNFKIKGVAPTGKASKVLSDSMGIDCETIHKFLNANKDYFSGKFIFNSPDDNYDLIIVDECSMIDLELFYNLFKNINFYKTKVILLGDIKQLPSIKAGNVLKDLMDSNSVPTVTLNKIQRQAESSSIIKNATNVINKEMIENYNSNDFKYLNESHTELVLDELLRQYNNLYLKNNRDLSETQILIPKRNGYLGVNNINHIMQQHFNENCFNNQTRVFINKFNLNDEDIKLYIYENDKVIQTKNNYDYNILNGEIGIVKSIKVSKVGSVKVEIEFDNQVVTYKEKEVMENLDLAYAITIHKSQGSQWKNVLIVLNHDSSMLLSNNLIYTAITRSSEYEIVLGGSNSIIDGIKKDVLETRNTKLTERILDII